MNHDEKWQRKRASDKRWKAANRDKVSEQNRRYHVKHREQRILYMRTYHRNMADKAKKYDQLTSAEGQDNDGQTL